jgi:hypothetical protein
MATSLLAVPNISTWDPYLPKMDETPKIYGIGNTSMENVGT